MGTIWSTVGILASTILFLQSGQRRPRMVRAIAWARRYSGCLYHGRLRLRSRWYLLLQGAHRVLWAMAPQSMQILPMSI